MQIMKPRPIPVNQPERIVWEHVAAVVRDGLDDGKRPEEHGLSWGEVGEELGEQEGENVEEKGFERVPVDGAVGVGDVEAVVLRVDDAVERLVDVAEAVREVDPGVDDGEGSEVL